MFRIRKITDPNSAANGQTVRDVAALLKSRFALAPPDDWTWR